MINQRNNYEPGRSVKRSLLSTRKLARKFGSIELPGLFAIAYGGRDALLFAVAVVLEVYGLYNLWLVGDILLMAAAGLFALDLVAALMWHCGQARRTELANTLAVTSDPAERAALKAGYPAAFTLVRTVGLLAIVGLAGFKVVTFMSFAGGATPLGVLLLISVTYALVALIHIVATGYFLANAIFQIAKAAELRRTLRHKPLKEAPNTVKGPRRHRFSSPVRLAAASAGRHAVACLGEGPNGHLHELRTWGVLLDSELSDLIMLQPEAPQKAAMAEEGLRCQLAILDSDPVCEARADEGAAASASSTSTSTSTSAPAPAPAPAPEAAAPKSVALREIGGKAAMLAMSAALLGLGACADPKVSAAKLDRAPVTILIGESPGDSAEAWIETLLTLTPEAAIAVQDGERAAIPDLTLLRAGSPEPVVAVRGEARPTFIDNVWGHQPAPERHLADLRARLATLDLTGLLAAPASASGEDAVASAAFEGVLASQLAPAPRPDLPEGPAPMVVYLEEEAAARSSASGGAGALPPGPVVHSAEEWRELLRETLGRGIVPIVLAYRLPRPAAAPPRPGPVPVEIPEPRPEAPSRRLFTAMGSMAARDAVVKTAEGWLRREGVTGIAILSADASGSVTLRGVAAGDGPVEVRVEPGDPAAAFAALVAGRCDLVMGPGENRSAVAPDEGQAATTEHVLGIVPTAVAVHPGNPLSQLTLEQLGDLLTGKIKDLAELGEAPRPVQVYAPVSSPEIERLLARRVPGLEGGIKARRLSEGEISLALAADPSAIGLLPLGRTGAAARALPLAADDLGPAIAPDASTVARDDYPLCQVYSLYLSAAVEGETRGEAGASRLRRHEAARDFVRYATLEVEGQGLVAQAGLYSQNVRFQSWADREQVVVVRRAPGSVAESAPERRFRETVAGAEQASIVFRFAFNDTALDARSQANVERLAALLASSEYSGSRLLLVGFADARGNDAACEAISRRRAEAVAGALLAHRVEADRVAGFGKNLPIDSNETEEGRSRNRRVEVWLRTPQRSRPGAVTAGPVEPPTESGE